MKEFFSKKEVEWIGAIIGFIGVTVTIVIFLNNLHQDLSDQITDVKIGLVQNSLEIRSNGKIVEMILGRQDNVIIEQGIIKNKLGIVEWMHKDVIVPEKIKTLGACVDSTCHGYRNLSNK